VGLFGGRHPLLLTKGLLRAFDKLQKRRARALLVFPGGLRGFVTQLLQVREPVGRFQLHFEARDDGLEGRLIPLPDGREEGPDGVLRVRLFGGLHLLLHREPRPFHAGPQTGPHLSRGAELRGHPAQ